MTDNEKIRDDKLQEQKEILERVEEKTSLVLKSLLSKSIDNLKKKN